VRSPRVSIGYIRNGFRGLRTDGQESEEGLACRESVYVIRLVGKEQARLLASFRYVVYLHATVLSHIVSHFFLLVHIHIVTVHCK
jgi:hypothetical protein